MRSKRMKKSGAACAWAAGAVVVSLAEAHAAEADAASLPGEQGFTTITVTGEKIERSLMDTPSSVAVLDADEIARRSGIDTLSRLLDRVPNLVGAETSNLAPAVRGVDGTGPSAGADAFLAGTRPRLNYQTDGRTLSYNESIFSDATLWDVQRAEVFRGPQSTLQGRNAIAGAIVIKTNDPTYEWEAKARALVGNYDTRQFSGAISGPLVNDQVAFRIAADRRVSNSYIDFDSYPRVSEPSEHEAIAVRGKLLIEPAALENFKALITLNYLEAHAPQDTGVQRPWGDHTASFPLMPRFGTRTSGAIADLSWKVSDTVSLETLLSTTNLHVDRFATEGDGNLWIDGTEFVAEPRLRFTLLDGRLDSFIGIHVFRTQQDETSLDLIGGGTFDDHTDTDALFGETTYKVVDNVSLTFGGRFEREQRRRTGGMGPFTIDFDETYEEFLPKASIAWRAQENMTVGAVIARGYNGGAAGFTYDVPFVSYVYEPEHVWNYEGFVRTALYDGQLTLIGSVFYNDYDNIQLPFDLNPDPDIWASVVRNADKAVTYGAELSARWLPQKGLEVFSDLGLLKTEIERYPGSGLEGNELARAPAVTFDAGVLYQHVSGVELGVDTRYSDAYFSAVTNEARGKTDPYWVANAQVAYRFSSVRLSASVTNLFDTTRAVMLQPGGVPADDTAHLLEPRTYNVGLQVSF